MAGVAAMICAGAGHDPSGGAKFAAGLHLRTA